MQSLVKAFSSLLGIGNTIPDIELTNINPAIDAWQHLHGAEGVAKDEKKGFELAEEGTRNGCPNCAGVLAYCYRGGYGVPQNLENSRVLAFGSSDSGSVYGIYTLGLLTMHGEGGLEQNKANAIQLIHLAAKGGLDTAQIEMGDLYNFDSGICRDFAEALRWYQLAANQESPNGFYCVATCLKNGLGVAANKPEALHLFRKAQKAGISVGTNFNKM